MEGNILKTEKRIKSNFIIKAAHLKKQQFFEIFFALNIIYKINSNDAIIHTCMNYCIKYMDKKRSSL